MSSGTVVAVVLFGLVALALVVFGLVIAYIYGWLIGRAQPRLDGALPVAVLDAPVEVLRDKHGVPHIYARSRADLFRAQGFVHAQDRLWQMEQSRRAASGTLAELFGAPALEADRFSRVVGFRRAAEADLASLDPEGRRLLEWYAEGVNAYIAARPGRLAAEFNLLRVQPAPWTAVDTLAYAKLIAWGLSNNWESELTRLRLLLAGGPYRAAELEPDAPPATPFVLEATGEEQQRLLHAAGLLLNHLEPLKQWLGVAAGGAGGQGSNAWVVAPRHSLTRKPVLANDPHLVAQLPGILYESHLSAPDFEVTGAGFPGVPCVLIGHNEEIAWGITNGAADQQDLYIERPDPADPSRFEFAGAYEPAQIVEESIRVRGRRRAETAVHVERVLITRHGPLISHLLPEEARRAAPALAVRWVGHEAGAFVPAILGLNQAATLEEAKAALRPWTAPSLNVVLADVRGRIAYQYIGHIPRREQNPGTVPAPGWTGTHEWQGYIPFDELPCAQDPESGRLVSANNRPVGDGYPHFLGLEFDPGWRALRIEELLAERERHSVRDMEEIQLDTVSKYAAELVRWITLLSSEDSWEKVSLQALRKWNLRMDADSMAALVFHYVLLELLAMVFGDKLGPVGGAYLGGSVSPLFPFASHTDRAQQRLLELLESEEESVWYTDTATRRPRTRNELLQEALTRAVHRLRDDIGDSTLKWQWGRMHQVSYAHPLGSVRLLRGIFNRGPVPVGGDNSTPLQTRHSPRLPLGMVQVIPAYRQIVEVGTWDRMHSVTPTGQSGHPFSPNYDDQMPMWREGVYHLMPWSREAVEKVAVQRQLLNPAAEQRR